MNGGFAMNEHQGFKEGCMKKFYIANIREYAGIIHRVARGAAGFICLAITATTLLSGCGGNIEDFMVDYAGVPKAERRACAIKHFGSPDQEMQGSLMVYKGRGIVVDTDGRDFLLLIGTDASALSMKDIQGFTGTIVGDIRITEPFSKVAELLKKNEREGKISKLRVYRVSAYSIYQKDNKKFKIIIKSRNEKVMFAQIRLMN